MKIAKNMSHWTKTKGPEISWSGISEILLKFHGTGSDLDKLKCG